MTVGSFRRHSRNNRLGRAQCATSTVVLVKVGERPAPVAKVPVTRDMLVTYPQDVAAPRINRETWAAFMSKLLAEEAGGNRTHLAQLLGVNRRTVVRWLDQETDVSEENVRQVARHLRLPAHTLLLEVGFYTADELTSTAAGSSLDQVADEDEPALALIREANLTPAQKRDLRARVEQMRVKHAEERASAIRDLLDFYSARRTA